MKQNKKLPALIVIWSLFVLFCSAKVFAQTLGVPSQQTEKSQQEILSSENGRFVFGQISDASKDQFMLDTQTGRILGISAATARVYRCKAIRLLAMWMNKE